MRLISAAQTKADQIALHLFQSRVQALLSLAACQSSLVTSHSADEKIP